MLRRFSVSAALRSAGENRLASTPPLPFSRTVAFSGDTKLKPIARSRRLGLTQTTRCEHRHAIHSVAHNKARLSPAAVSSRNPRIVYTRQGTRAKNAATEPSSPAYNDGESFAVLMPY